MAKNYTEDLAAWMQGRQAKAPRQNNYMVAFLAVKGDVQAGLDAGYPMKTIWEHMKATGRLHCRYETFTHHVKRYIKVSPALAAPTTASPLAVQETCGKRESKATAPTSTPPQSEPPRIGRFTFDASPRKEDLL